MKKHISVNQTLVNGAITQIFVDITAPEKGVQVQLTNRTLWVNVDGVCVLRICKFPHLEIEDNR